MAVKRSIACLSGHSSLAGKGAPRACATAQARMKPPGRWSLGDAQSSHVMLLILFATHCVAVSGRATCAEQIAVPKVALLFLARSGMPLAPVWEPWFRSVAGLVPLSDALARTCDKPGRFQVPASLSCSVDRSLPVLQQQALYSVYVHSSRHNFTGFPPGHLFEGTLIPEVVATNWGDTIDATRAQLRHALQDPLNERFLLLSDADVPLYPARMVYLQLMGEPKSRVAACKGWDLVNINRYTCRMADMGVDSQHWRKGAQWLSFLRPHAQMVADDEMVRAAFNQHCAGVFDDMELGIHRGCLSDEHYYHTLFAVMGKEKETDCRGSLSFSDFSQSIAGHPKKYVAADVSVALIPEVRTPVHWMGYAVCAKDETVWRQAREGFKEVPLQLSDAECDLERHQVQFRPMETWCQLFARKFAEDAAEPLAHLFSTETSDNVAIYIL